MNPTREICSISYLHEDTHTIKNPYLESQIQIKDQTLNSERSLNEIAKLYDEIINLEGAIEIKNQKYIFYFFKRFANNIHEIIFDEDNPLDFIEFIFPYIINLIQTNTPKEILYQILLSLFFIVLKSHYYSLKFADSPAYEQLISIIQANITDDITGISINIIISLSQYEELQDILYSVFPIESLVDCFLSDNYQAISKHNFILIFSKFLFKAKDDETVSEIFSSILECLSLPNIQFDYVIKFLHIIGDYYIQNNEIGIEILPEKIIQIISDHISEIIQYKDDSTTISIFYLIYLLTNNGIIFYYPVEEMYQIILNEKTNKKLRELIVSMMAKSITKCNEIEYSKLFITESIVDVIEFCFEYGSKKTQNDSIIFIESILLTENLEMFLSILNSSAFIDFLDFIENVENDKIVYRSVGILGNAYFLLQKIMPESEEFQCFISNILQSELLEQLNFLSEKSEMNANLFMTFCNLIESESVRMFGE